MSQESYKRYFFSNIQNEVMLDLMKACTYQGHNVSGSVKKLTENIKAGLESQRIDTNQLGWKPNMITAEIDAVITANNNIVGNLEVERAKEINIPVFTVAEFVYNLTINKQRMLIFGDNKRLITSIIIHTLDYCNREFDYFIPSNNSNLDSRVKLSNAPLLIIENDNSDFLSFQHHIAVFGTLELQNIHNDLKTLIRETPKGGIVLYCEKGLLGSWIKQNDFPDRQLVSYKIHKKFLNNSASDSLSLFSISVAKETLQRIGVTSDLFYSSLSSFHDFS